MWKTAMKPNRKKCRGRFDNKQTNSYNFVKYE